MRKRAEQPFSFEVVEVPERDNEAVRLEVARRSLVAMIRRAWEAEKAELDRPDKGSGTGKQEDAA